MVKEQLYPRSLIWVWLFFYAQARVRKIAADAAPGPRGRAGGKPVSCSIRPVKGKLLLTQHPGRADEQEEKPASYSIRPAEHKLHTNSILSCYDGVRFENSLYVHMEKYGTNSTITEDERICMPKLYVTGHGVNSNRLTLAGVKRRCISMKYGTIHGIMESKG